MATTDAYEQKKIDALVSLAQAMQGILNELRAIRAAQQTIAARTK